MFDRMYILTPHVLFVLRLVVGVCFGFWAFEGCAGVLGYYIIILYYSIIILLILLYYVIIYCTILFSSSILPLFPSSSSPSFPNILNHPFLLFLYTHLFFFLYNPDTSFPSSFILYLSVVTYAYLCSFLIHLLPNLTPHVLSDGLLVLLCWCVFWAFKVVRVWWCVIIILLYYYILLYYILYSPLLQIYIPFCSSSPISSFILYLSILIYIYLYSLLLSHLPFSSPFGEEYTSV